MNCVHKVPLASLCKYKQAHNFKKICLMKSVSLATENIFQDNKKILFLITV